MAPTTFELGWFGMKTRPSEGIQARVLDAPVEARMKAAQVLTQVG